MDRYTLEHSDVVLVKVHSAQQCGYPCAIHRKTNHNMRKFPQWFRSDNGMMERTCPHGIGHPDPDGLLYFEERGITGMELHGCDGCCL